jgi:hypothetical protein
MTIKNLPDEVLLDIFDHYRHTFGNQLSSERVWNNKNGWFKLAHVCHNWRSVVLASPSRLRLRLYFASNTPTRAVAPERLLHLPIIVDYSSVIWKGSAPKRFTSALRYSARVCRIAIRGSNKNPERVAEALNIPFPALESLELHSMTGIERIIRSASFLNSIQSLRHLRLDGFLLTSVLPFLSVTRSLVDLTLNIDKVFSTKEASLLTHVQHMPHLRNLRVFLQPFFSQGSPPTTSIILPELTCFHFVSECTQVEWFVSGLDTPNLRKFHISITDRSRRLHIPYLTKFIRAAGADFVTAQLTIFSGPVLRTDLFARPHSIDGPPSNIFTINTQFSADPEIVLSSMLATLEDIFISSPGYIMFCGLPSEEPATWCKFFEEFRNVKVLRLLHGLEARVVEMLRQPTINTLPLQEEADPGAMIPSSMPIITNGSELIFPLLEEIVLYAGMPYIGVPNTSTIGETVLGTLHESMLKLFEPFVTARKEVGRPVKVFWSTDGQVPKYSVSDAWY